ncbi:MAG: UDP-N-acetylmuramoyl-L-alanyl-D-glutamate--2,6-diaminopimelate ligase [Bacteroidales bacterium]
MWQKTKNLYHLGIAIISNAWFRFPSKKLTVIGVTGTDGKTTTTSLIYHILHIAGFNASMVSSVGAVIGGKNYDVGFHVTTPSSFSLQRFLNKAVIDGKNSKPNFLVLETTSHALDQYRVFGIKFDVGVLTNVTHEHLDYHKTYENYLKAKAKLLKMSETAVINKDDESYVFLNKIKNKRLITYGLNKSADVNPQVFPFKTDLIGEYNQYNVLAAISVCRALGVEDSLIRKGIESFTAPKGRGDIVYKKDFTVMIDFAHTPNSIEQILKAVRPGVKNKIIHVFGSAGARDESKRPLMGEMSSKYADVLILTAEDPRKEPVEKIMNEIESGINKKLEILRIPDRKKAIKTAIEMAKKGDFVLITGKSHEKSMNYGHGEVAWDEYKAVREAL